MTPSGPIDPIVFDIDDSRVHAAVDRSNLAIDNYFVRVATLNKGATKDWNDQSKAIADYGDKTREGWDEQAKSLSRLADTHESSYDRMTKDLQRYGAGVESAGRGVESFFRGAEHATRGAVALAGALAIGTKALAAHATAAELAEGSLNRLRAARIGYAAFTEGLGGAAVVAGEVAAIFALEKAAEATYEKAGQIQRDAIASSKSGLSYQDTATLDFVTQRFGQTPDFFNSAVKAAGGVDQLSQKLRELAGVRDPIERVRLAIAELGPDAEKILPYIGDRFADNTKRVQEWGLVLDQTSRENIVDFKRDIDALKGTFTGLGDAIKASETDLGNWAERSFAGLENMIVRGIPALLAKGEPLLRLLGTDMPRPYWLTEGDQGDAQGAAEEIRRRLAQGASADTVQAIRKSLTPGAEKAFAQDQGEPDIKGIAASVAGTSNPEAVEAALAKIHNLASTSEKASALRAEIAQLQGRLFITDKTSPDYGKLAPGAQFREPLVVAGKPVTYKDQSGEAKPVIYESGYRGQALALQKYTSDQQQLAVIEKQNEQRDLTVKQLEKAESDLRSMQELAKRASAADTSTLLRFQKEYAPLLGPTATREERSAYQTGITQIFQKDLAGSQKKSQEEREKETQDAIATMELAGRISESINTGIADDLKKQNELVNRQELIQGFNARVGGPPGPNEADIQQRTQLQLRGDIESAKLTPGAQPGTIAQLEMAARKEAADYELKAALDKAKIEKDSVGAEYDARFQYQTKLQGIRRDFENSMLQLQKEQTDEIARTTSGLFHTLFTKPQDFGKQLENTLREAFLKPIDEGLGQLTGKLLRPTIFGETGEGGIAGALRGIAGAKQDNPLVPLHQETNNLLRAISGELSAGLGTSQPLVASATGAATSVSVTKTDSPLQVQVKPESGSPSTSGAAEDYWSFAKRVYGDAGGFPASKVAPRVFAGSELPQASQLISRGTGFEAFTGYEAPPSIKGTAKADAENILRLAGGSAAPPAVPASARERVTSSISYPPAAEEQLPGFLKFAPALSIIQAANGGSSRPPASPALAAPGAAPSLPASILALPGTGPSSELPSFFGARGGSSGLELVTSSFEGESTGPGALYGSPEAPYYQAPIPQDLLTAAGGNAYADVGAGAPEAFTGARRGGGGGSSVAPAIAALAGAAFGPTRSSAAGPISVEKSVALFSKSGISNLGKSFGIGTAGKIGPDTVYGPSDAQLQGLAGAASSGTSVGSVLSSPGASQLYMAAGEPLTMAGLTGVNRGTGAGIGETTAGGALLGAGIGTMILPGIGTAIGAGVGAAAGALAGVGEMLAGVESPRNKAKRLVKQMYNVTIGNGEADKIVQIAASKYANQMDVAVRSPEVRQMLGLYAAGTGQAKTSNTLSADTPHGASFVDVGGKLMQENSYMYGNPYSYQSSLPVYGGNPGQTLPTGNTQISLNISGAAVAPFMTGQLVTPEFVASQTDAAYNSSIGRTTSAMALQEPGSIVS